MNPEPPAIAGPIKVGDRLRDNDARMSGTRRTLTVTCANGVYVWARDASGREFRYKRGRIFTDDKPRRSGLSVVRHSGAD